MIYDLDSKRYLARHPRWALGWFDRLRGMIGRRFAAGEFDAMVFPRCGAVHSWWMTVPIDLVFLDRESKVVRLKSDFRPWRSGHGDRTARGRDRTGRLPGRAPDQFKFDFGR